MTRSDYIRMRLLLPCSMIKVPCANDIGQMLAAVGEIGQRLRRLDLRIQNDGGGPYHIALLDLRQEVQELRLTLQRLLSS